MMRIGKRGAARTIQYFKDVAERRAANPDFNSYARDNRKHGGGAKPFRHVPPHLRDIAWAEYNRLYDKAISEGKPITQQKIGSMMGNAAFIAMYVRGTKRYQKWCKRWFIYRDLLRAWNAQTAAPSEARRNPKDARTFIQ